MSYIVIKEIGQGGFGRVEEVVNEDGDHLALKTFFSIAEAKCPPELYENAKLRFLKEAKIQHSLSHPNIVPVLEHFLDCDPPSYVMPLAISSLSQDKFDNYITKENILPVIYDVLSGLEYMHSKGIYHRDLKLNNILRFLDDKEIPYYALSDFGFIHVADSSTTILTSAGIGFGPDYYKAPEVVDCLSQCSVYSDIYSVGCILHDFVGINKRLLCNEIDEPENPYGGILLKCTKKVPKERYSSVEALRKALYQFEDKPSLSIPEDKNTSFLKLFNSIKKKVHNLGLCLALRDFLLAETEDLPKIRIFEILDIDSFEAFYKLDKSLADNISSIFIKWASSTSLDFSFCDVVARRILTIYNISDNCEVKAHCLIAFLLLGTSHNRWYVEKLFYKMCSYPLENEVESLLIQKMEHDPYTTCKAIKNLEESINVDRKCLNAKIAKTLEVICND